MEVSETAHDTYQNQKMDSHLEVASEKHTEIVERLARIETRVTVGVGLGAIILGGLIKTSMDSQKDEAHGAYFNPQWVFIMHYDTGPNSYKRCMYAMQ